MANQAQIDATIALHNTNDRVGIISEYSVEEPYNIATPVTKTKDDLGVTFVSFGDPYEAYYAGKADSNG